MKNTKIIVIIVLLLIIGAFTYVWSHKTEVPPVVDESSSTPSQAASIVGCYRAGTDKDVFTLHVTSLTGTSASGTLEFKNYQKDSSSGVFQGTYDSGVLLGNYSFRSEGMDSVMQVIFKRTGDNFVRGYGSLDSTGTKFSNLDTVTYNESDPLSLFVHESCPAGV